MSNDPCFSSVISPRVRVSKEGTISGSGCLACGDTIFAHVKEPNQGLLGMNIEASLFRSTTSACTALDSEIDESALAIVSSEP